MSDILPQLDSQGTSNDCALIAIQNYTGKNRESIVKALPLHWSESDILRNGTPRPVIAHILTELGYKFEISYARRGQWRLSGIAIWKNYKRAHATALMSGIVLDTRKNFLTIPEYRNKYQWHLEMVYKFDINIRG